VLVILIMISSLMTMTQTRCTLAWDAGVPRTAQRTQQLTQSTCSCRLQ
jgi:hypothetical protein